MSKGTLRVFLPHGSHVRFVGVEEVKMGGAGLIAFEYDPLDEKQEPKSDTKAHAVFSLGTIAGYSFEQPVGGLIEVPTVDMGNLNIRRTH